MTLEEFSYIATIIGTLSIPLSGLFIWLQLRQQTRLAKVANTQALVELSSPLNLQLIQDKELARLWVLGATSYDAADEVEKYRYKSLLIWWLILHENIYYQWQNGLLDKPIYDSWRFDLQQFVLRQLEARWMELRPNFTQAFALHIDELIKSPNHALQRTGAAVTPVAAIQPPSPTPPGSGRATDARSLSVRSLDVGGLFDVITFRHWIRIIGIALVGLGLLCLPSIKRSPQSYGSGFAILSDPGFLLWIAIILIVSGAIAFVGSFVGSGRPR